MSYARDGVSGEPMLGKKIGAKRCPQCAQDGMDTSRDNLILFDDGHARCFACNLFIRSEGAVKMFEQIPIQFLALQKRKLTKETCEWYTYGVGKLSNNRVVQVAQFYNEHGDVIAQKYRHPDKKFHIAGQGRAEMLGLWGDITEARDVLVITEGEIDAMSVYQVTGHSALSLPIGAGSARAALSASLSLLAEFKKVVLFFDADEAGQKAVQDALSVIKHHQGIHVVKTFPHKDANDALVADDTQAILRAIETSEPVAVGKQLKVIKPSQELLEKVMESVARGPKLPYPLLDEMLGGHQLQELAILFAMTGKGKTTLVKELIYDLIITHNKKIGGLFLEETEASALRGLIAIDNNVSIKQLQNNPDRISAVAYKESYKKFKDNLAYFCDDGIDTVDSIKAKMEHLIVEEKCDYLIYDNISYTMQGVSTDDERKAIDTITYMLKGLQIKHQVGVLLVIQKKQGVQSALGERHRAHPDEAGYVNSVTSDIKGSAGPAATASLVLALDEHHSILNFRRINVLKNRKRGTVGPADEVMFDPDTGRLVVNDTTKNSMF